MTDVVVVDVAVLTPAERMLAALADPDYRFTRDQVVHLMATAARWAREAVEGEASPFTYAAGHADGYRDRVAEENATYPPTPYGLAGGLAHAATVREYRRRAGVDRRYRRRRDFLGGPVGEW